MSLTSLSLDDLAGEPLSCITLWRPWCWSIYALPEPGAKRIENRPNPPPATLIGQLVALHSGKVYDEEGARFITRLAVRQLQNPGTRMTVFGLETDEDGEWEEWYDDNGDDVLVLADSLLEIATEGTSAERQPA